MARYVRHRSCFIVNFGLSNIVAHGSMHKWDIDSQEKTHIGIILLGDPLGTNNQREVV